MDLTYNRPSVIRAQTGQIQTQNRKNRLEIGSILGLLRAVEAPEDPEIAENPGKPAVLGRAPS